MAQSALIINEIGEVGLDQHTLYGATDTVTMVENACICCTGLPGLASALAELFWARLERRVKPFLSVVVETTGLADPLPILETFQVDSLLRERYQIAGVITALSATAGLSTLGRHPAALSQIRTADLIVLPKADRASAAAQDAMFAAAAAINPHARLASSGKASLNASTMLALLSAKAPAPAVHVQSCRAPFTDILNPDHRHSHDAESFFIPLPALDQHVLQRMLDRWISQSPSALLRIKGVVALMDGSLVVVHWAPGDGRADVATFGEALYASRTIRKGLTVIVEAGFDAPSTFRFDDNSSSIAFDNS